MIDGKIRQAIDPLLNRIGRWLAELGVTPNGMTGFGFALGLGACLCIAFSAYLPGLFLLLLSRLCDGLDGSIARISGTSDLGAFLDITLDFIFYSAFVFAFAMGQPETALPAAFLILSFVGTGASFLAYAIFAEKRGLSTTTRGSKSLYYLGGLTEGFETIAVFSLICIFPEYFQIIAWIFGGMCWVTTGTRIFMAFKTFSPCV